MNFQLYFVLQILYEIQGHKTQLIWSNLHSNTECFIDLRDLADVKVIHYVMQFSAAMKINKISMATKTFVVCTGKYPFYEEFGDRKGINRSRELKKDILCSVQSKKYKGQTMT